MVDSNHVLNRWSGYDPATDLIRVALLRLYSEHGRAPTIGALAERAGLEEAAIRPLLEELAVATCSFSTASGLSAPIPSPTTTPATA